MWKLIVVECFNQLKWKPKMHQIHPYLRLFSELLILHKGAENRESIPGYSGHMGGHQSTQRKPPNHREVNKLCAHMGQESNTWAWCICYTIYLPCTNSIYTMYMLNILTTMLLTRHRLDLNTVYVQYTLGVQCCAKFMLEIIWYQTPSQLSSVKLMLMLLAMCCWELSVNSVHFP